MTVNKLYEILSKKILILDGATGTELQNRGMPVGVCPEEWVVNNPDVLKACMANPKLFYSGNIALRELMNK